MHKTSRQSTLAKKMLLFVSALVIFAGLTGCWFFGEQAPLADGLYLSYDFAGSNIRITFSEINADTFYAALTSGRHADLSGPSTKENRTIVDRQLKTKSGAAYEAGALGPLWIPPSSVKKGGSAHGDRVVAVREWNGWQVGVVKANFGRGALRGEWYYEKNTGFLVGGMRASLLDEEGGGVSFILKDSSLKSLIGKLN